MLNKNKLAKSLLLSVLSSFSFAVYASGDGAEMTNRVNINNIDWKHKVVETCDVKNIIGAQAISKNCFNLYDKWGEVNGFIDKLTQLDKIGDYEAIDAMKIPNDLPDYLMYTYLIKVVLDLVVMSDDQMAMFAADNFQGSEVDEAELKRKITNWLLYVNDKNLINDKKFIAYKSIASQIVDSYPYVDSYITKFKNGLIEDYRGVGGINIVDEIDAIFDVKRTRLEANREVALMKLVFESKEELNTYAILAFDFKFFALSEMIQESIKVGGNKIEVLANKYTCNKILSFNLLSADLLKRVDCKSNLINNAIQIKWDGR